MSRKDQALLKEKLLSMTNVFVLSEMNDIFGLCAELSEAASEKFYLSNPEVHNKREGFRPACRPPTGAERQASPSSVPIDFFRATEQLLKTLLYLISLLTL